MNYKDKSFDFGKIRQDSESQERETSKILKLALQKNQGIESSVYSSIE